MGKDDNGKIVAILIPEKYIVHKAEVNTRFDWLKANEEELNCIFAEIHNMVGDVPIKVEDKCVSIARIQSEIESAQKSKWAKLEERPRTLLDQLSESVSFEEELHHLADQMIEIDLYDGVRVNYAMSQKVLALIK